METKMDANQVKTDATLKEMKAGKEHLKEEIKVSKEEMEEEVRDWLKEMKAH
jgi:hypothetical protein